MICLAFQLLLTLENVRLHVWLQNHDTWFGIKYPIKEWCVLNEHCYPRLNSVHSSVIFIRFIGISIMRMLFDYYANEDVILHSKMILKFNLREHLYNPGHLSINNEKYYILHMISLCHHNYCSYKIILFICQQFGL